MRCTAFVIGVAIGPARLFAQDAPVEPAPAVELPEAPIESQPPELEPAQPPAQEATIPAPPEPPVGHLSVPSPEAIALLDDSTYFEPDPHQRLHGWLAFNNDRNQLSRIVSGAILIGLGGISLGVGIASLFAEDVVLRDALVLSLGLVGVLSAGLGVGLVLVSTPPEDRFERWRETARRGPISAFDLGRYEGEFLAEVEMAKFNRMLSAAFGFGLAAAGGIIAASSSFFFVNDEEEAGLVSLAGGATFAILGSILGALSLAIETSIERDWERYSLGLAPRQDASPSF